MILLEALREGFAENSPVESDESNSHLVNVLLRSARRYVADPSENEEPFRRELETFLEGLARAAVAIEEVHELGSDPEQILLERLHESLEEIDSQIWRLHELFALPSDEKLNKVVESLKFPVDYLLLVSHKLEEQKNAPSQALGRPICGDLVPVPPLVTRLMDLCFEVAKEPTELNEWQSVLSELQRNYEKALSKANFALTRVKEDSLILQFTELRDSLRVALAGFQRISRFADTESPHDLDQGWVQMMRGLSGLREVIAPKL